MVSDAASRADGSFNTGYLPGVVRSDICRQTLMERRPQSLRSFFNTFF